MKENSFISIRNGTIASTIAGVVLLVIPTFRSYAAGFFIWVWSVMVRCWGILISYYALPGWVWLFIIIFAIVGIFNTFKAIRGEQEKPEYYSYDEDFIYQAKWRWQWVKKRISDLWCYCPVCDATLVYKDSYCRNLYNPTNKTEFICENCGNRVVATVTGGNKNYAISAVKREINRRVRVGEYKNH